MKKSTIITILSAFFLMSFAFVMGAGYKDQEWKAEIYTWDYFDPNDFYADSSWNYQEGYKLNLPEELRTMAWYNDDHVDLLYGFIDSTGNIQLGFTGKTMSQDSLLLTP